MKCLRVAPMAVLLLLLALCFPTVLPAFEKNMSAAKPVAVTGVPTKAVVQKPVHVKPDLVAGVPHHYTGATACSTLGWLMWNKGAAPLPDNAYAATSQGGGVVIRIYKMDPMQVVKNVMLKDVDPLKKMQPVNGGLDAGPIDLGPSFSIACSKDMNNNQWGKFQIRLDADQKLDESDENNNAFTKVVPCLCP